MVPKRLIKLNEWLIRGLFIDLIPMLIISILANKGR